MTYCISSSESLRVTNYLTLRIHTREIMDKTSLIWAALHRLTERGWTWSWEPHETWTQGHWIKAWKDDVVQIVIGYDDFLESMLAEIDQIGV